MVRLLATDPLTHLEPAGLPSKYFLFIVRGSDRPLSTGFGPISSHWQLVNFCGIDSLSRPVTATRRRKWKWLGHSVICSALLPGATKKSARSLNRRWRLTTFVERFMRKPEGHRRNSVVLSIFIGRITMMDASPTLDLREIRITPLQPDSHVLAGFSCGEADLDRFIVRRLAKYHSERRVRAFCATRLTGATPLGLYCLSLSSEESQKLDPSEARHFSNQKSFPAVYIQTLAVMSRYQSQGLGTLLLVDALQRAHMIAENAAVFGVALRALNSRVETLYSKYGFHKCEDCQHPLMVLPIWTLDELLKSSQ